MVLRRSIKLKLFWEFGVHDQNEACSDLIARKLASAR